MSGCDRHMVVRGWNAEEAHQRLAGLASWAAFSARWRAHQGMCWKAPFMTRRRVRPNWDTP